MHWVLRRSPPLLLVLAWLSVGAGISAAHGAPALLPATPAPAATAMPSIEAIAPGDVPVRADADERFLQEIVARSQRQDPTQKLSPELDELAAGVRHLAATAKRDELRQLPAIRLESLERHWVFYDRQLDLWRRELQKGSTQYSDDAADLAKKRAVWEATRASADSSGIAQALRDRIDGVLAQIAAAEQAISGPLNAQFQLNHRANDVQSGIDAGRRSVESAIRYYDTRLRIVDSPTLLDLWRDPKVSASGLAAAAMGTQIEREFLGEYFAASQDRIRLHGLFAVVLLPVLIWLRTRSRKLIAKDPGLQPSAHVLLRPLSAWLVMVLVGTLFFESDGPLSLHQVALVAALVPVLRLLPPQVFALLGPWPYIVTALYLLERLGGFLVGHPLWYRLQLLAVTLLGLAALLWLLLRAALRDRKAPDVPRPRVRWVLRTVGWLAVLALATSVIANLWGNVSLAETLTRATLTSGYTGLALYAGATVLNALLRLLAAWREMSRFRAVTQRTGPLLQSLQTVVKIAALVSWFVATLNSYRVFRPVADWGRRVLTFPIEIGQISITLGNVLLFALTVRVAFWLARTIRATLQEEVLPRMSLPRGVGNSVSTLTYYALVMVGILVALAASGFRVTQLAIVLGALSVGIGFGLQNVVNNFVSGLILMFERPIQPGDIVEVSGVSGKVSEIGMRATKLSTFEGADVVVPNGTLLSEKLINWTLSDMNRRIDVNIGVAYGSNPRKVLELLMDVTRSTPGVATHPEPTVFFIGFGTSSLDFSIRAWTNNFGDWVATRSELNVRLYDALTAAGIEIPYPQHDVHLRSVAPDVRAQLAGTMEPPRPPQAG